MLEWDQCTIGYQQNRPVFENFSLRLDDSACLIGPAGCGKSTLLAAMMGFVPRVDGHLRVGNRQINGFWDLARQHLSYLPPTNVLPLHLTLGEYLTELARLDGLPWLSATRTAASMAERLKLTEVLGRPNRQLSFGMKRRALLAGCLLKPSEWLLVDHATLGLDPEERRTVIDLLHREASHRGVLMTTLHLDDIHDFGKHVVILRGSQVIFGGSTAALQERARGHVFRVPPSLVDQERLDGWQPLPEVNALKVFRQDAQPGYQELLPSLEDGYLWTLFASSEDVADDEERRHVP